MYYSKDTILYLDGKFLKAIDANIDLFSQTLHYGFGAFEGIRSYTTPNGVKLFKGAEHFIRLQSSCDTVGIPIAFDVQDMINTSYELLERNHLTDAYLRPLVYCGPNMYLSKPKETHLMICTWKWEKYHGDNLLRLCISSYQRPNPSSIKISAKICGHYVNGILASNEAKARGYDEALQLDMNGYIAAAPAANFFMEKDGALHTPPPGHIFPSITRQVVLDMCHELGIRVIERQINPLELQTADSAFLCGTAVEIAGVESIDGYKFRKEWKNSIGITIQQAYRSKVHERDSEYVII